MNPRTALKSMARIEAENRSLDRLRFQYKIVLEYVKAAGLNQKLVTREYRSASEPGGDCDVFMSAVRDHLDIAFPENIYIDNKVSVDYLKLAKEAEKTRVFKAFKNVCAAHGCLEAGLVFKVKNRGAWIAHNLPCSPAKGKVRLYVPSGIPEISGLHIVPWSRFLEEMN